MKMAKAIRQQAVTAERVAASSADAIVADQMKSLAQAFRVQAEILKKKEKNKKRSNEIFDKGEVQGRRNPASQEDPRGCAEEGSRDVANWVLRHPHHHARRPRLPFL
ncbi:hypothetical protein [Bradyrhizobium sp. URHC0002]